MFCRPCIVEYHYIKETRSTFCIQFLRINSLYMFRALLTHLQEALYKQQLVYCVCVMFVGCYQDWSVTAPLLTMSK
jgi:hypothetical protein